MIEKLVDQKGDKVSVGRALALFRGRAVPTDAALSIAWLPQAVRAT